MEFLKEEVAENIFAIDINSCFESSPGVKRMDVIRSFVASLKID